MEIILKKLFYSLRGLGFVLRNELSFQIEIAAAAIAIALAIFLRITPMKWMVLSFSISILLIAELINTAIELLADYVVKLKFSHVIAMVKDILSGTVLVCIINLIIVCIIILLIPLANIFLF